MYVRNDAVRQRMLGAALLFAIGSCTTAKAQGPSPEPAAWRIRGVGVSGLVDGYYSYNANHPGNAANGQINDLYNQINDLYNFDDKADQFSLSEARLTLDHDPGPVGAHADLFYGRTNSLVNVDEEANFVERAFVSLKPPKAHTMEVDLGKFVTAAGAETIEAKDNWNYSRSLLFSYAIPYFHFGGRAMLPLSKSETAGVQLVNGWNKCVKSNGGLTGGFTNALVTRRYTWNLNLYTGPENSDAQKSYRNLIDTTLLLTPDARFSAYVNYDYGRNRNEAVDGKGNDALKRWLGVAVAAQEQLGARQAIAGRAEYFNDPQGYTTGKTQQVKELTATYERRWHLGLLARMEFRRDWSDQPFSTGRTASSWSRSRP